jgi:excisionase family DNA binding protein
LLTVEEVAKEFHVTKQTVYNWINAGRIRVVRLFGLLRIEQSEVERIKRGE